MRVYTALLLDNKARTPGRLDPGLAALLGLKSISKGSGEEQRRTLGKIGNAQNCTKCFVHLSTAHL
jgi:hypothetical protein